jgi:ABC-2 type transport system ATP-binding protein
MPEMKSENPIVEVQQVFKHFKDVEAVNGISFSLRRGDFLAILGPNGAGKTTMVEMVEGIQFPDSGSITIDGKSWASDKRELNQIIGLSLQETQFMDKLSVRETLKLFAGFYGLSTNRVNEIIELVGLQEKVKSFVVNLSGGQRQRLALGIALLNKPSILLLDEPTTGLDPNARREVWAILHNLRKELKTSLILTTHYMEEAEQLCDYIIVMDHGRILKEGTLDNLLNSGENGNLIEFSLKNKLAILPSKYARESFSMRWNSETFSGQIFMCDFTSGLKEFLNYLETNNQQIDTMFSRRKTLDDLFIELTGRHLNE